MTTGHDPNIGNYRYQNGGPTNAHSYLLPAVRTILSSLGLSDGRRRIFELGCGNGSTADFLHRLGYEVVGVDPSKEGIAQARKAYPHIALEVGSCYDDLSSRYGRFPVVLSLEVVEHVFLPRVFAESIYKLLEDSGVAIVSTPFHSYWKNLALAITGRMDSHFTALWDHGHIKFWSVATLRALLDETGFHQISFVRVGRIPPLAKSMIAIAKR